MRVTFLGCWFEASWLVVFGGVDGELAQDFAGLFIDDDDIEVVDEHPDGCAGVFFSNSDVVEISAASQGDVSCFIDFVFSNSEVSFSGLWCCFCSCQVGVLGCFAIEGTVRAVMVVMLNESVDEGLKLSNCCRWCVGV